MAQLVVLVLPALVSWPVPHPVYLEWKQNTGKAACTCVGVCRSADVPGKGMGFLIPEEDVWHCAGEAQPESKPLVTLCEKPSGCGRVTVSELWWVEHAGALQQAGSEN